MPAEGIQLSERIGKGDIVAVDAFQESDGIVRKYQLIHLVVGPDGGPKFQVSDADPLPVAIPAGMTVPVTGAVTATITGQPIQIVAPAGTPLVVTATDLDIRALSETFDSVASWQGGAWAVDSSQVGIWQVTAAQQGAWTDLANQGGAPWSMTATDLHIRDLKSSQDSVTAVQGG